MTKNDNASRNTISSQIAFRRIGASPLFWLILQLFVWRRSFVRMIVFDYFCIRCSVTKKIDW